MSQDLNRRNFHQLALAALGGVMAGSLTGCEPQPAQDAAGSATPEASPKSDEQVSLLLEEPHVCRGLNLCKNQGASKENACAGQGTCASVAAHSCGGMNECKGQGGCGEHPGENSCKGMGSCGVPLEHAWDAARKNFEAAMKAAGKEFGPAPAKS
jgi:hypothetical protein